MNICLKVNNACAVIWTPEQRKSFKHSGLAFWEGIPEVFIIRSTILDQLAEHCYE